MNGAKKAKEVNGGDYAQQEVADVLAGNKEQMGHGSLRYAIFIGSPAGVLARTAQRGCA